MGTTRRTKIYGHILTRDSTNLPKRQLVRSPCRHGCDDAFYSGVTYPRRFGRRGRPSVEFIGVRTTTHVNDDGLFIVCSLCFR